MKTHVWLLILAIAVAASLQPLRAEETLRVGVYPNQPLTFVRPGGRAEGFCIDILNHLAARARWRLQFVPGTRDDTLQRLRRGEVELVAGLTWSNERARQFDFNNESIIVDWGQICAPRGARTLSIPDLAGMTVAVQRDDVYAQGLRQTLGNFGISCRFLAVADHEGVCSAIKSGRATAGVLTRLHGPHPRDREAITRTPIVFSPLELRFAMPRGHARNAALIKTLDAQIRDLRHDRGSAYYVAQKRWLMDRRPGPSRRWIIWVVGIAAGLTLLFLCISILLRIKVRMRTAQLGHANLQLRREIAHHEETTEKLRKERDRVQTYLDIAGVIMVVLDRDGTVQLINRKGVEILGYREEDIVGRDWFQSFLPARNRDTVVAVFQHLFDLEGQPIEYFENPILTSTGKEKMIAWHNVLLRDDSGEFVASLSSGEDITERRRTEESLRRSEARYRMLMELASDGIFITDRNGRILDINTRASEMLGYTRDELMSMRTRDIMHELPTDTEPIPFDALTQEQPLLFEAHLARRDGSTVPVEINAKMLPDGTFQAIARDIAERKRMEDELREREEQLRQSQKMEALGRLAGGVAHDFNNILTAIEGYCDLIFDNTGDERQVTVSAAKIDRAAEMAASLTRKLLAFSRKQVYQPKVVEPNKIVEGLQQMLRRIIGEDVRMETVLDPRLQRIVADPLHVEQVLLNLAVNARDAMARGGKLTIETRNVTLDVEDCRILPDAHPGNFVCISVQDTGAGIPPDIIDRIFEPFFSTKPAEQGTGLGLSTVYGIVKQHDGWINVYSEVGHGTVFRVYLPATTLPVQEEHVERAPLQDLQGHGERILLIEDEDIVREFATKALEHNGYVVFQASSAEEARAAWQTESGKFTLIFSDMILPDMGGLELVEELLGDRGDVPALFSSGYTDRKSYFRTMQARGFGFLQKPYRLTDLLQMIKRILRGSTFRIEEDDD